MPIRYDTENWAHPQFCLSNVLTKYVFSNIETVSPEGTFCDTVQVPFDAGDMQLI